MPPVAVGLHASKTGSPVVNQRGEWVRLIFDGNLDNLGGRHVYTDTQARSVDGHARAILHALECIDGAGKLVQELRGTQGKETPTPDCPKISSWLPRGAQPGA